MALRSLRKQGQKTVMVNYNPETVSTDYDESDRLYFEELSFERVMDIHDKERNSGVIVSMGGQTAQNLVVPLHKAGVPILGTSPESIDIAEDRDKFSSLMDKVRGDVEDWKPQASEERHTTWHICLSLTHTLPPVHVFETSTWLYFLGR